MLLFCVFVYEKSIIIIDFVLVFAVFTQFLSFSGFVKVFCFGKMRKCIFSMFFFWRTSGNPNSRKLREFESTTKINILFSVVFVLSFLFSVVFSV